MVVKVDFEEIKQMNYEAGKKLLESLGYVGGDVGETESNISDYATDEYFTLYDEDGETVDVVSYEMYCNGDGDNVRVVKQGWSHEGS